MREIAFWLFFSNAVLLILHWIDSAYWEDRERLRTGGGLFLGFLLPLIAALLYGLVEFSRASLAGSVISLLASVSGLFIFIIHIFFMARGRKKFRAPVSIVLLAALLPVSAFQAVVTLLVLFGGP